MRVLVAVCILLFSAAVPASAGEDPIYTGWLNNRAVSGYDTVAYFTEGKPVKGNSKYTATYKGAEWRFSSTENLALFQENPEKYAPQYGGYCAWGLANGHAVSSDPEAWSVVGDKLYLNYNKGVKERWLEDTAWAVEEANKQFPELVDPYSKEEKK